MSTIAPVILNLLMDSPHVLMIAVLQAMQKLQERVTKAETLSNDAVKASQAQSLRTAEAVAVRHAQTEAALDGLLAFTQTHAAELAKRDAAIAELQTSVANLQGHSQQSDHVNGQHFTANGQQAPTNGQQQTADRQGADVDWQAEKVQGQTPALLTQQESKTVQQQAADTPTSKQTTPVGPSKGRSEGGQRAARVSLKGSARQSIDGAAIRQGLKAGIKVKGSTGSKGLAVVPTRGSLQLDKQTRVPLTELSANEV